MPIKLLTLEKEVKNKIINLGALYENHGRTEEMITP
jgi:hypothetical protein